MDSVAEMRTSMPGCAAVKRASRGISHFIAKVGPTPMVSTRTLAGAVTWATVAYQSFANALFGFGVWAWLLARYPASARPLAAQFARFTGKQLVIDNRGGAGGTLGAGIAAKAPADGYTLFMGAVHHAIAPSMYPKLDYDIQKDLIPLVLVASVPQIIVVNPKNITSPDFKSFLELMKKNPGRFNYGSAGAGTSHHLAGELFKQQTKTFITHIPYRGAGPALNTSPNRVKNLPARFFAVASTIGPPSCAMRPPTSASTS